MIWKQVIRAALLITAAMFVCNGDCSSTTSSGSGGSSGVSNEIVLRNIQYIPQQFRVGTSYNLAIQHGEINVMNNQEAEGWEAYKKLIFTQVILPTKIIFAE